MNCARRASTPDCWAVEGVGQILLFAGTLTSPSLGARASTPLFSDLSVTAGLYCTQYTCFGDVSPDHLFWIYLVRRCSLCTSNPIVARKVPNRSAGKPW